MVSQTMVHSFQRSFVQLNKSVASKSNRSQLKKFSAYLLFFSVAFSSGIYGMYETYYQHNKIKGIFQNERSKLGAEAHHSLASD